MKETFLCHTQRHRKTDTERERGKKKKERHNTIINEQMRGWAVNKE